jgi:type III secretion protein U
MAEKTEKATPKKLKDARKKGQVAKSQDLPSAFTFIASIWVILATVGFMYGKLGDFVISLFKLVTHPNLSEIIPSLYIEGAIVIFVTSMPVLLIVSFIGVLINFLAVGPTFAPEVFKFDIKKFDPVQNLKAKFKLKTLVELIKSILKISIACYIIYTVMWESMPVLIKAVSMPIVGALLIFKAFLMEVVIKVGLFFIIIAVADFIYQRKSFANEMMMEKFEVKQEYKNTEGDPLIKSKRRQLSQEIAYQEGPLAGVKRSRALVTNPTHLAIAIGYEKEIDAAPYILAKGKDIIAGRMVAIAKENNIPIVQNVPLAHKLWESGELYDFIPESTYEAVAEILRWVSALNTEQEYDYTARLE